LQRGYDNSLSSARECAACAHWEHFDKHERERRKQLVAEWKRREEEKLDAGSSSSSSEPEKHWDNWKHFEVRQVRALPLRARLGRLPQSQLGEAGEVFFD